MQKSIFSFALPVFMAATLLMGCQSAAKKEQLATDKVMIAQENLESIENQTEKDSIQLAHSDEWKAFKMASLEKIQSNDKLIANLRIKMKTSDQKMDAVYKTEINTLEQKNNELKARMTTYETNRTDWILFKTEFNKDMDGLGSAINDFGKKK
jgi:outer membrane murein-binding lipoprotein Lpp